MYASKVLHPFPPWIFVILLLVNLKVASAEPHPVRVWGDISTIYRYQDRGGGSSNDSKNWLNLATINASTYIWQPWFALLDGSLTFSVNETDSPGTSSDTTSENLGGDVRFNLFPTSRFPFLLYARQSELEQDNPIDRTTTSQTTVGVRQQYRSRDGKQTYSGRYEHIESDTIDLSSITSDSFNFGALFQLNNNLLAAEIAVDETMRENQEKDEDSSINLRHTYTGSSALSLENQASVSKIKSNFSDSLIDFQNNQFSSFAIWNPNNSPKLNITGNLRVSEVEQSFSRTQTGLIGSNAPRPDQTSMNLNQGLTYKLNRATTLRQSINLNQIDSDETSILAATESAGATYSPDSWDTQYGEYSWNTGTSFAHQHGDDIDTIDTLSAQIGHNLITDFYLDPVNSIKSSFIQSIGYSAISNQENIGNLTHSMSLSWSDYQDDMRTAVRFTATDSRNDDLEETEIQLYNLQADSNYRFDRNTFLAGEVTWQKSRFSTVNSSSGTRLITANLRYTKNRFWDIFGMRYESEITLSDQEPTDARDIIANDEFANRESWENEWIYRIGLFESRLTFDYIRSGSEDDLIIIIQLTRNFGDL